MAVNSADDLINPPDLGILEREIKRVKHGKAVVIPESPETRGHGTHTRAASGKSIWKSCLKRRSDIVVSWQIFYLYATLGLSIPGRQGYNDSGRPSLHSH